MYRCLSGCTDETAAVLTEHAQATEADPSSSISLRSTHLNTVKGQNVGYL